MKAIHVKSASSFHDDFPDVMVGPRGSREQSNIDLWSARRVLEICVAQASVPTPFRLRKIPETSFCATPDFEICSALGLAFIELTEATSPNDQREMTLSSREDAASLIGSHGGRGEGGYSGDQAELEIAADILSAIERKASRYPTSIVQRTVLGVYVNSNPGMVVSLDRVRNHLSNVLAEPFLGVIAFKSERDYLVLSSPDKARPKP